MGALKTQAVATGKREIVYPESDGKPMAETDVHRDEMADLIAMLKERYAGADDVYVSGNLLLYYEEGNPRACVAPDVIVVFGVPGGRRRTYKLWLERVPPTVVIEVTSRKTKREDLRTKRELYAQLGVAEYYLYDPTAEYLYPPLQGFQLARDEYAELPRAEGGGYHSPHLGLALGLVGGRLTLIDVVTGTRLLRPAEQSAALVQAEALALMERERADLQRQRAEAAEAELALLRAQLGGITDATEP
jgi:Uma2 family endonuclease